MTRAPDLALALALDEVVRPAHGIALAEARRQNPGERDLEGWCLLAVRTWLDVPPKARDAIRAWAAVPDDERHPRTPPPAGVPVFWSVGHHGHVALSAGGGKCYSTDIKRRGKADRVPIDLVGDRWGARYLGWTESLNGRRVYTPKAKARKKSPARPAGRDVEVRARDTVEGLVRDHAPPGTPWRDVWRDERNDDLRALRRRPELIRPGDHLWIPAKK